MKEGFSVDAVENSDSSSSKKKKGLGHLAAESSERSRGKNSAPEKAEAPRRSLFEDAKPAPEHEAPLEQLSAKEEKPVIVKAISEERGKVVDAEVTDGSAEAEAAKTAAAEFYAEAERTGDPDVAYEAAREVIGASPETAVETDPEAISSQPEQDSQELPEPEPKEEIVFDRAAESVSEEVNEPKNDETAAAAAGSSGVAVGGGSGVAGGGAPPRGPVPPFGPAGGSGYYGGPGGPPQFGGAANSNLIPPMPVSAPNTGLRAPEYDAGNPAAAALIGGIIGYLIGRRRGRIKTEKKLLPIQKKLEKQVVNLDWQLQEKEAKIRRVAAEQVHIKGAAAAEHIRQSAAARQERRQQERVVIERRPAPEAHQLHGSKRQQEHIGHMLLAAEAPLVARQPKPAPEITGTVSPVDKKQELSPEAAIIGNKRIETLNRAELLSISEKIIVDGSSLRQIYESRLVGERGLRRLVNEHLRGGDLKKALRQEVVEREIDFERDPIMRDLSGSTAAAPVATGGGTAALQTLLQKAEASLPSGSEEAAFFKARADYQASQHKQQQKQRRLVDVSLTAVIAALISTVIYIYITRS